MIIDIDVTTIDILKRAYSWLDYNHDSKVSLDDLKQACSISEDSEAQALFESLNPSSNEYITFDDFCKGVLDFPEVLKQLTQECMPAVEKPSDKCADDIMCVASAFNIKYPSNNSHDDISELISAEMKNLSKHTKDELIKACKHLYSWVCSLKDYSDSLISELSHRSLESTLQNENLNKDKERAEQNYNILLGEHHSLEISFRELQQKHLQSNHETRELKMRASHVETQQDSLQKNIEELKSLVYEKDRQISELNKRIRVNNSLKVLTELNPENHTTTKHLVSPVSLSFKVQNHSSTPTSKKVFDFDKLMDKDGVKDQIIKNLKKQLNESMTKAQRLEQDLANLLNKNQGLLEKVNWLSVQRPKFSEDEEDYRFDTIESLRDEIAVVDNEFVLSSRQSISSVTKYKEVAVQAEIPQLVKRKSRYSCFSLFG